MSVQIGIPNVISQMRVSNDFHYYKARGDTPVNRYLPFQTPAGQLGVWNMAKDFMWAVPLITTKTIVLEDWAFRVTIAQAGKVLKSAIYADARNTMYPTTLLHSLEALPCNIAGLQVSSTIDILLRRNVLLWWVIWGSGTPEVLAHSMSVNTALIGFRPDMATNSWGAHGYGYPLIYTGNFPDPFPPWLGGTSTRIFSNTLYPAVMMKYRNA